MSARSSPPRLAPSRPGVPTGPRRGIWWLSPVGLVLLVTVPVIVTAHVTPWTTYRIAWRTDKWLTEDSFWLLMTGAIVLAASAAVVVMLSPRAESGNGWPNWSLATENRLARSATWILGLTAVGYLAFFGSAIVRGLRFSSLAEVVQSQNTLASGFRDDLFATIPGVTTLTQCGVAFAILAGLLLAKRWDRVIALQLGAVLLLSLFRAYFLAERLALLELAIPLMVIGVFRLRELATRVGRVLITLLPAILLPLLVIFFGIFEYSRSWAYYQQYSNSGFWNFAVERLTGYYATALNNGQVQALFLPDEALPRETLLAVWEAPVVSQLDLYERLSPPNMISNFDLLVAYANPEFNSPCGICGPLIEWGTPIGLIILATLGAVAGLLYISFSRNQIGGLLFYPIVVVTLMELPRLLYFSQGRTTPALVALFVAWLYVRRAAVGTPRNADSGRQEHSAGRGLP
jgi:hypothetical protein